MSIEPDKNNRKKFDLDLRYGKVQEKKVADMLQDKKIEVKTERGMWIKTGNIAIEYQSHGKPSGISVTEADYWFHNLNVGKNTYCTLVFRTDVLKQLVKGCKKSVTGGDNYAARMWLLPLEQIFDTDLIADFVEENK